MPPLTVAAGKRHWLGAKDRRGRSCWSPDFPFNTLRPCDAIAIWGGLM